MKHPRPVLAAGESGRRYSAPAGACAADLLMLLVRTSQPLALSEITRQLGCSKSLVFRVLRELEARDLVERVDHRFGLGIGSLEIGGAFIEQVTFSDSVRGVLRDLKDEIGETASLGLLHQTDIVYLMREEGRNSVITLTQIGRRLPAHCTALGKALLSTYSDDAVKALFTDSFRRLTSRSIASFEELAQALAQVRATGYAVDEGEAVPGRSCLATCIHLPGLRERLAAISLSGITEDFAERRGELLQALFQAKERVDREAAGRSAMSDVGALAFPGMIGEQVGEVIR